VIQSALGHWVDVDYGAAIFKPLKPHNFS